MQDEPKGNDAQQETSTAAEQAASPEQTASAPQQEDSRVTLIEQQLAEERTKAERYLANWQRSQADFINYKRRAEQEQEERTKFANAMLILKLLPVVDDIERALDTIPAKLAGLTWFDGIRLIHRKLVAVLESDGVTPIAAEGHDFDPRFHEAVLYEPGAEQGNILQELQRGYKLHDRVIRPAMVKVASGPAETPQEAGEANGSADNEG